MFVVGFFFFFFNISSFYQVPWNVLQKFFKKNNYWWLRKILSQLFNLCSLTYSDWLISNCLDFKAFQPSSEVLTFNFWPPASASCFICIYTNAHFLYVYVCIYTLAFTFLHSSFLNYDLSWLWLSPIATNHSQRSSNSHWLMQLTQWHSKFNRKINVMLDKETEKLR